MNPLPYPFNLFDRTVPDREIYNSTLAQTVAIHNSNQSNERIKKLALFHLIDCLVPPNKGMREVESTPQIEALYLGADKLNNSYLYKTCNLLHKIWANSKDGISTESDQSYSLRAEFKLNLYAFDREIATYFKHRFDLRMGEFKDSFDALEALLQIENNSLTLLWAAKRTIEFIIQKKVPFKSEFWGNLQNLIRLEPDNLDLRKLSVDYFTYAASNDQSIVEYLEDVILNLTYLKEKEPQKIVWVEFLARVHLLRLAFFRRRENYDGTTQHLHELLRTNANDPSYQEILLKFVETSDSITAGLETLVAYLAANSQSPMVFKITQAFDQLYMKLNPSKLARLS